MKLFTTNATLLSLAVSTLAAPIEPERRQLSGTGSFPSLSLPALGGLTAGAAAPTGMSGGSGGMPSLALPSMDFPTAALAPPAGSTDASGAMPSIPSFGGLGPGSGSEPGSSMGSGLGGSLGGLGSGAAPSSGLGGLGSSFPGSGSAGSGSGPTGFGGLGDASGSGSIPLPTTGGSSDQDSTGSSFGGLGSTESSPNGQESHPASTSAPSNTVAKRQTGLDGLGSLPGSSSSSSLGSLSSGSTGLGSLGSLGGGSSDLGSLGSLDGGSSGLGSLGSLGGGSSDLGSLGSLGGSSGGLGSTGSTGSLGSLGGLGSSSGSSSGVLGGLGGLFSTGSASTRAVSSTAVNSASPTTNSTTPANGTSTATPATSSVSNAGCKAVTFVFARGTGESGTLGTVVGPPVAKALASALGEDKVDAQGVDYPADAGGNANLGASGGPAMAALAKKVLASCPDTKLVLSGYSQGGMVVHNALSAQGLDGNKIAAVVCFGDPLNGQEFKGVDSSKVKEFCGSSDFICASGATNGSGSHLSYGADADTAAAFIVQLLQRD